MKKRLIRLLTGISHKTHCRLGLHYFDFMEISGPVWYRQCEHCKKTWVSFNALDEWPRWIKCSPPYNWKQKSYIPPRKKGMNDLKHD